MNGVFTNFAFCWLKYSARLLPYQHVFISSVSNNFYMKFEEFEIGKILEFVDDSFRPLFHKGDVVTVESVDKLGKTVDIRGRNAILTLQSRFFDKVMYFSIQISN